MRKIRKGENQEFIFIVQKNRIVDMNYVFARVVASLIIANPKNVSWIMWTTAPFPNKLKSHFALIEVFKDISN